MWLWKIASIYLGILQNGADDRHVGANDREEQANAGEV